MLLSFREFLGTPIRDRLTKGLLGRVADLIVNPANGEILALYARADRKLLVPTVDVVRVASGEVWVDSPEALAEPSEIIRIADIIAQKTAIYGNKVFTVSRTHLGSVTDYQFETNGWVLMRFEVAKKILGIPTEKKLISATQIVQIKPTEITVRDAVVDVREKARVKAALGLAPTRAATCAQTAHKKTVS